MERRHGFDSCQTANGLISQAKMKNWRSTRQFGVGCPCAVVRVLLTPPQKMKRFFKLHSKQTRELESVQKAAFESHPPLNTHWPAASFFLSQPFLFFFLRKLERSLKNAGAAATSRARMQMSRSRGLLIFPFQLNEDSLGKKQHNNNRV